ncbi:MAG: hypothetical protein IIB57_06290 [Planctomycetes bacterium]|nr:hypothetical protein [Planctomycetota bacterium]
MCDPTAGCCFDDTLFCFGELTATGCLDSGGTPQSGCDPDPCRFACCLADGTCTEGLTVDECDAQGASVNARGSTCTSVSCAPPAPTKWVLTETPVNPDGDENDHSWVGFQDEQQITYTTTATSVTHTDRFVDNLVEQYNVTVTSNFPTPAAELNPGDTVMLSVSFTHSGTVLNGNPGAQFQYWVGGHAIDPISSYFYLAWSPDFSGETSTTYSFVVPNVGSDGTWTIAAFWWNCGERDVSWVYRPG